MLISVYFINRDLWNCACDRLAKLQDHMLLFVSDIVVQMQLQVQQDNYNYSTIYKLVYNSALQSRVIPNLSSEFTTYQITVYLLISIDFGFCRCENLIYRSATANKSIKRKLSYGKLNLSAF